ncbi:Teicoplanin resistance associated membrane protein TcaA [Staphylococcus aureus]|nr:Teicoplanin resistance associated membrane protein TcaA [Staphylococcus aureus]
MKSCPKCGQQAQDDVQICTQCGHKFDSRQALYRSQPMKIYKLITSR